MKRFLLTLALLGIASTAEACPTRAGVRLFHRQTTQTTVSGPVTVTKTAYVPVQTSVPGVKSTTVATKSAQWAKPVRSAVARTAAVFGVSACPGGVCPSSR